MRYIYLVLLFTSVNALAKADYVKSSFALDFFYELPVTSGSTAESRPYVRGAELFLNRLPIKEITLGRSISHL